MRIDTDTLKAARESKGLTQERVARTLDISLQTYGKWERGLINPPLERVVQVAEVLGIDPSDLSDQAYNLPTDNSVTLESLRNEVLTAVGKLQDHLDLINRKIDRIAN